MYVSRRKRALRCLIGSQQICALRKVFIAGLEISANRFNVNPFVMPQDVFMGFGYNPMLREQGERLDMLEYVAWMKRLLDAGVNFVTFWDASAYQMVNVLPKGRFCGNPASAPDAAAGFLETLAEELQRPKRAEIAENCALRNKYLWNLRSLTGLSPTRSGSVRSVTDLFRGIKDGEDGGKDLVQRAEQNNFARYATLFCQAAEYVERMQTDEPWLLSQVFPPALLKKIKEENPAAQFYLPMEMAEAMYLQNNTPGILSGKYGPQSEQPFDNFILGIQQERFQPYAALRSPLGPRKPGYLKDNDVLWTSSSNDDIAKLIRRNSINCEEGELSDVNREYGNFVRDYLRVLAEPNEPLVDCAIRLRDAMRIEEVK